MPHVFITGAAKNTGFGIAQRFLKADWTVHVSSRRQAEIEEAKKRLLEQYPDREVFAYTLDLKDYTSIQEAFRSVARNTDKLDAFVQNAAHLGMDGNMFDRPPEYFDDVMQTNVCGGFRACREAALMMQKTGGGSIVTLGSVTYRYCVRNRTAYIASKGAIVALTKAMALDCSPYRIRVNCVLPGTIATDRWEKMSEKERQQRKYIYPLSVSTFEDVAEAVFFLAGNASRNMTGTELVVDGGTSIMAAFDAFSKADDSTHPDK